MHTHNSDGYLRQQERGVRKGQEDEQGVQVGVMEKWRESVITVRCILGTKHNLGIQTQRRLLLTGYFFFS